MNLRRGYLHLNQLQVYLYHLSLYLIFPVQSANKKIFYNTKFIIKFIFKLQNYSLICYFNNLCLFVNIKFILMIFTEFIFDTEYKVNKNVKYELIT